MEARSGAFLGVGEDAEGESWNRGSDRDEELREGRRGAGQTREVAGRGRTWPAERQELERTLKENPGTEVQTGTRSSERGDEEQDRPGRWLDVAGGAAGVWIWKQERSS
ncbi:hypothetical protein NQZ68_023655 [Dissostichus eleginoides]|nr:hypothetical protein NQZ68_023655 [Dissostichus eleginoides]